jgi:hypothetical protein
LYTVETVQAVSHEIASLPKNALDSFASLVDLLELHPWSGDPYNRARPEANMRTHPFGAQKEGLAVYVILEDERRVVVVSVAWRLSSNTRPRGAWQTAAWPDQTPTLAEKS